ncbi:hypothetical protein TNCV_3192411 [Trichonephila clavipes]|nr:hypothetical protein TNCV_3192411 [Trichonephila clavipes]
MDEQGFPIVKVTFEQTCRSRASYHPSTMIASICRSTLLPILPLKRRISFVLETSEAICTTPIFKRVFELKQFKKIVRQHQGSGDSRRVAIMDFGAPLTIGKAYLKIIMSSFLGFCEWNTRNRWRDGQVCPDVDKELWRLGPDSSGVFWRVMRQ